MFLSEWCEFSLAPCLAGKRNLMTVRDSMLLKSRTSLTCFRAYFIPGRAKDLSAPRVISLSQKMYRTIILPVVFYACETWSLTLREERKLRVFENMVLRRIFGPRRNEVKGEWRRLHNEELNDLYSSPNIVRLIKSRRTLRLQ